MLPARVPVLVAGGGPVGLAAAVELGRRGIGCLVVEPRATVSHARPRCKTVSVRSMEHLRRWGLADRLRARAPLPVQWSQDVVFCTSLAGRELSRFTGVLGLTVEGDRCAETGQQAPQYLLEEVLREAVAEIPACTLATDHRVVGFEQDETGVRVTVTGPDGTPSTVTADYLIGADGPRSAVRAAMGADYHGGQALRPNFGLVFDAPELWRHLRHGPAVQYWIVNAGAPALMGPIDRTRTWWMIAFGVDRNTGERDARRLIDAAAGTPVDATVLSTDPWTARMQIVDRMRDGRVFLAGDAAHLNPPFGGHGLNTGIGDAVDLGWKLAAVLDGWADPGLLDSYEAERRPVQERVIREATANMAVLSTELLADNLDDGDAAGEQARQAAHRRIQQTKTAEFHALDLVLDIELTGPAVAEGGGRRVPHLWLGPGRSLYDELGPGFALLILGGDGTPGKVLLTAAHRRGIPAKVCDLRDRAIRPRYGADLVLVRPDQHIAWRGNTLPPDVPALLDRLRGVAQHA
ncbi:FAD-dependent monooxygenase [Actinoplanes sp. Pm04-4]|uniref:FAD-dependent monooxygenase n=1 Tax=Paractinoplanes pyxinae TaxID=2997416 RepID=A0ABT4BAZ7_9ACTN|nr:FAD-dependent monooxygenase [Actinoplanes pyxinae]MCY1143684.1 FAD-dependent monooxygenase [Actinoplanes pyxinae]